MTNEAKVYTDKAIELLDPAKTGSDPARQRQASLMALSYLRLAQLAQKYERADVVYEAPVSPQQRQIQPKSTVSLLPREAALVRFRPSPRSRRAG